MILDMLKAKIMNRTPKPEGKYRHFSVLVPLIKTRDQLELLFEIRSEKLNTQPNEICFPGGKMEENESPVQCAVRETCEELHLSPHQIDVIGPLDYLVMPYNSILYPFLGTLHDIKLENIKFNRDEVSHIFTVPLNFFMKNPPLEHPIHIKTDVDKNFPFHMIQNGRDYHWKTGIYPVYFYHYEHYVIWGMTARIIKNLTDILKEGK